MKRPLKILMLEDSEGDADLIKRTLLKRKRPFEFHLAMDKENFLQALDAFGPDVILSDNSLPQFDAVDALKITRQRSLHIPFILVTGTVSEEFAANIIKEGADDYILKDRMIRLPAAIDAALHKHESEEEKLMALQKLMRSEEKYRLLVERVSDGFIALDTKWDIVYANKIAEEMMGRAPGYLMGKNMWAEFPAAIDEPFYEAYHRAMRMQKNIHLREYSNTINGWVEMSLFPSPSGLSVYFRDITEQMEAEEEARKNEEKYRVLIGRITEAFIALDKNWRYTYLNKQAGELFQRSIADLTGKNIWTEFPDKIGSATYEAFHKAMNEQCYVANTDYYAPLDLWQENHIYPSEDGLSVFIRDITKRKKAEEEILKNEEQYRDLVENISDLICTHDLDGRILSVNRAAEELIGHKFTPEEKLNIRDILDPDKKELFDLYITELKRKGRAEGLMKIKTFSGRIRIWHYNNSLKKTGTKTAIVRGYARDITESRKAEEDLRQSEARLNEAQAIAHISNWEIDLVQNKHAWSDEFYRIYGLDKDAVQPSAELFLSFMHPGDVDCAKKEMAEAFGTFKDGAFNFRFVRKDGTARSRYGYIEWRFEFDKKGRPVRLFGIVQDITERKVAEKERKKLELELQEQQRNEQLKIISTALEAQEKERNAIGQELHDNVNQILVGTKLMLSMAKNKTEEGGDLIATSITNLQNAIQENRKIAHELVTPDFKTMSLVEQVHNLTDIMLKTAGIDVFIDTAHLAEKKLDDQQKLAIYRIAQEQCTNIVKYAKAGLTNISLSTAGGLFTMIISDDGRGMKADKKTDGIGLRNIKGRLGIFNGTVTINTAPGKGFKLEITIPLKKQPA